MLGGRWPRWQAPRGRGGLVVAVVGEHLSGWGLLMIQDEIPRRGFKKRASGQGRGRPLCVNAGGRAQRVDGWVAAQ